MKRAIGLFFVCASVDVLFLISAKFFRPIFPLSQIGPEKIIGYAQYYKYPLYFDNIVFFIFILIPIIMVFAFRDWLRDK